MPLGGGVSERRPGTRIVADVLRDTIGERRVFCEQLPDALQIADVASRANVTIPPPITEVREDLCRSRWRVRRHIAPTSIEIVAIRELNRPRAVAACGVDVRAACQQFVNDLDLPRHHGPMDWLIRSSITDVQQFR